MLLRMDCGRRDVSKKAEMILEDKKVSNIYSSHSVGMVWVGTFGITPQPSTQSKKALPKSRALVCTCPPKKHGLRPASPIGMCRYKKPWQKIATQ